ncbi:hypothetical protein BH23CHL5_BH23CHL5_04720 [soil metagenome]
MSRRMRTLNFPLAIAMLILLSGSALISSAAAVSTPPGFDRHSTGLFQESDADFPESLTVADQQYLFDRTVPVDPASLDQVDDQNGFIVLARPGAQPREPIFAQPIDQPENDLGRYLPTNAGNPDLACLAEAADFGPLSTVENDYVFAGIESDIPTSELLQVADAGGQFVYSDADAAQPQPELFLETPDGLVRFQIIDAQGRPLALPDAVTFANQAFSLEGDVTTEVDPANLVKVGCIGPYTAFAASGQTGEALSALSVLAGGRYFGFVAAGPAVDEEADTGQLDTTEEEPPEEATSQPEDQSEAATEEPAEETESTPPPAEDEEGAPAVPDEGDTVDLPGFQVTGGLDAGAQPAEYPRELVFEGERFLFDRLVPLDPQALIQVAQEGSMIAYSQSATGPFDALLLSVPDRPDGESGRYLPQRLNAPDQPCVAESGPVQQLSADGALYVSAGYELDLPLDDLQQFAEANGQPVYADQGANSPYPELFLADDAGLIRFLLAEADGRPAALTSLAFSGAEYEYAGNVSDTLNRNDLTKVGCAGPFPVFNGGTGSEAFAQLFVGVGNALLQFDGEGLPVEETTPTETIEPTEVPTEVPTEIPTETPAPTETATQTAEPQTQTATMTSTATPTETPQELPTATLTPTEEPQAAATSTSTVEALPTSAGDTTPTETATPAETPIPSADAGLPQQIEVQNTTYIFNQVNVDVDIDVLVQVDVMVVQGVQLVVYAEQELQGAAPRLYFITTDGELVGEYVVLASAQPQPPPILPMEIELDSTTFIFNEVDISIDVQTLVQVDFIVYLNISLTIYAETQVQAQPTRLWAVAPGGVVIGQYVQSILVVQLVQPLPALLPTVQFQPPAAVPTLPPSALPTAPSGVVRLGCTGTSGELNSLGVPTNLPNRFQFGGIAYALGGIEPASEAGTLTRLGCVGPFEVASTDQEDRSRVLYLRAPSGGANQQVYRYEAALTFLVVLENQGNATTVQVGENRYQLSQTWQPGVYSGLSVILFQGNTDELVPNLLYAVNVGQTVVGEAIGEYRLAAATSLPNGQVVEGAELAGLNPDLTINGQLYVLVAVYLPVGTTTNGFLTLYGADQEGSSETLLGRDKRDVGLFIYRLALTELTGG